MLWCQIYNLASVTWLRDLGKYCHTVAEKQQTRVHLWHDTEYSAASPLVLATWALPSANHASGPLACWTPTYKLFESPKSSNLQGLHLNYIICRYVRLCVLTVLYCPLISPGAYNYLSCNSSSSVSNNVRSSATVLVLPVAYHCTTCYSY
jgi:hypothetical protein